MHFPLGINNQLFVLIPDGEHKFRQWISIEMYPLTGKYKSYQAIKTDLSFWKNHLKASPY